MCLFGKNILFDETLVAFLPGRNKARYEFDGFEFLQSYFLIKLGMRISGSSDFSTRVVEIRRAEVSRLSSSRDAEGNFIKGRGRTPCVDASKGHKLHWCFRTGKYATVVYMGDKYVPSGSRGLRVFARFTYVVGPCRAGAEKYSGVNPYKISFSVGLREFGEF